VKHWASTAWEVETMPVFGSRPVAVDSWSTVAVIRPTAS
jgi:hypothetical protein